MCNSILQIWSSCSQFHLSINSIQMTINNFRNFHDCMTDLKKFNLYTYKLTAHGIFYQGTFQFHFDRPPPIATQMLILVACELCNRRV
jgi:hypothetical protein